MPATEFYTANISGPITIHEGDSASEVSIVVTSGTVTVTGSRKFQNVASGSISLSSGQSLTLSSKNGTYPIGGVTIDATGGGADIVISF